MNRWFKVRSLVFLITVLFSYSARAQRLVGIDVSDWQNQNSQGAIDWTTVHKPVAQGGGGKDFAFIRSTRGGTTGTYNEQTGAGTGSYRYDDYAFEYNITNATAVGMFAGIYHFGRQDIVGNTGTDEANHMLEMAGPWMKPGYLLPVFDLEARQANATKAELSKFATDFALRIQAVKGVIPLVYINQNYSLNYVDSSVTIMPNWVARWPNQADPNSIDIQNGDPPPSPPTANVYGVWNPQFPTVPEPQPWNFWQYASTAKVKGIGGGSVNVDVDVAHGDVEFIKDFLVPALWTNDLSGTWTTIANWNTNADPSGKGPAARLPGTNDTVSLDRPVDIEISLSSGTQNIRRLFTKERLKLNGGTLNVSRYAQFDNTGTISSGKLSAGSMQVSSGVKFIHSGGTVAATLINNGSYTLSSGTATMGTVTGTGTIIQSGGLMTATSVNQKRLTLSGGTLRINTNGTSAGTSVVQDLSVTSSGRWDLNNNDAVINYNGGSPLQTIRSLINTGYAGGNWNGVGIDSSAAATAFSTSLKTGFGFVEAFKLFSSFPATFSGQSVDSTSILMRYTVVGDADLSGRVDIADFNRLSANYGNAGTWYDGDFDYNGTINILDFNILAAGYGKSLPGSASALRIAEIPATAIPLPAPVVSGAVGMLIIAAGCLRSRHRR